MHLYPYGFLQPFVHKSGQIAKMVNQEEIFLKKGYQTRFVDLISFEMAFLVKVAFFAQCF